MCACWLLFLTFGVNEMKLKYAVLFNGHFQGEYLASSAVQAIVLWCLDYGTSVYRVYEDFGAYPVCKKA